ncbi:predicted protein [Sclerotinia sclerotiorum 1980 UF-70]|uniref:Uncharacterized protein n=2 Tax=Sclerotinia sclerotiorum (strain ATCC 18683 / 1980 / Ss-1) TaxID=665079 RepID=A7EAI5_SCLS1|nr:predicted protein [Sclerotinia sclerotiorum 1980 UF-70]APA08602.1 hypothetical protein sscle_04g033720 [Sclerotinia sclerotiorum 1980 UF-70]EDN99463.1 predicted protein [Sclerotinia sclerotiorum 1980 UF-70]
MTSFEPIYYTYMPTAPCSRRATTQKHSFPVEEQHTVPDRRLFDDTQRSNDDNVSGSELQENIVDNDYNIDLPTSYSISQMNTGEDSSLENKIWEDKIASPRIYDDDSSSIGTVLDPYLYQKTLIKGLQKDYDIQSIDILDYDNKAIF